MSNLASQNETYRVSRDLKVEDFCADDMRNCFGTSQQVTIDKTADPIAVEHTSHKSAIFSLNLKTGSWISSKYLDQIFSIDKNFKRNIENWISLVHPDDKLGMIDSFLQLMVNKPSAFNIDYRIIGVNDKKVKWVNFCGEITSDNDSDSMVMIGAIHDITNTISTSNIVNSDNIEIKELTDELLWQCDTNGYFTFLNSTWTKILGYRLKEMIGQHYSMFLSPIETENGAQIMDYLKSGHGLNNQSTTYLTKNGQPIQLYLSIKPIFDSLGNVNGISGVGYEDSAVKNYHYLIDSVAQELDRYFNGSTDLLCVIDSDGSFIRMNINWSSLLGFTLADVAQKRYFDLVHPDDLELTLLAISVKGTAKKATDFVNRCQCKDGSYTFIKWHCLPIGNFYYAVERDNSDDLKSDFNLKRINKELIACGVQKDKFLSIIAHDLRNPLSSIMGLIHLLAKHHRKQSDDDNEHIIVLLNDSISEISQLMENLLDWALSKSDFSKPNYKQIDVNELITTVYSQLKTYSTSKQISLSTNIPSNSIVWGDENMVKTIFRNLVSNAIKFSYPNSQIEIEANQQSCLMEIKIKDTGIGINTEKQQNLFNAHNYIVTQGTSGEKGSGFGLPLCKELIEKQGGNICVESEAGRGTIFHISLPLDNHISSLKSIETSC